MYKNDHEYKPIQLEKDQRKVARKKKKKDQVPNVQ